MTDPLLDSRRRPLRDLRISVTDRCNFRCIYCMPKSVFDHDHRFLPKGEILSYEEIVRLARLFVAQGVTKIRLTGGEPLVRRDIEELIEQLARPPGVEISLTTNGSLLAGRAQALREAGLHRVTVSLDAIDEGIFARMNDVDFPVAKVLAGIDAAASAGLAPIKVNAVIKRGVNDGEIIAMARHFRGSGHVLRFIEYMDAGNANHWRMDDVVPATEILRRINSQWPIEPVDANYPGEVAERWRYQDGGGEVGVIASVSQAFCSDCTRLRLATDGRIYTCLFATQGTDLRALLRSGASDAELTQAITDIWQARDDRYSELRAKGIAVVKKIEMSYIGG